MYIFGVWARGTLSHLQRKGNLLFFEMHSTITLAAFAIHKFDFHTFVKIAADLRQQQPLPKPNPSADDCNGHRHV